MVVIRYEGPRGAPGMPELLDPTSRITALCRQKNITIALMTDARFSGGSVGLVIGHVAPEAYLGGPIALVEDGDTIVVDLNKDRLDCRELADAAVRARRAAGLAGGGAAARRRAPGREAGDEPAPEAHARGGAPRARRRGHGDRLAAAARRRAFRIGEGQVRLDEPRVRAAVDQTLSPVMNRACWEQRNATTAPKSSASPMVRMGLLDRWESMAASKVMPSLAARLRAVCSTRSVAWEPGRTALMVTPGLPRSPAPPSS